MLLRRSLSAIGCRFGKQQCQPLACGLARTFGSGGNPRGHLLADGTRPEAEDAEGYHDPDPLAHRPPMNLVKERGQTFVKGKDWNGGSTAAHFEDTYGLKQDGLPFYPRQRLYSWGNYKLLMKAEFGFFYIPTVIIFGLCLPSFACIYALEESVYTTMTVKVTGRQWYWVYEVESPTDDEEDDE